LPNRVRADLCNLSAPYSKNLQEEKGAAPEVSDFPGQVPGQSDGQQQEESPPAVPDESPRPRSPDPDTGRVEVPAFPPGTPYQNACVKLEELRLNV